MPVLGFRQNAKVPRQDGKKLFGGCGRKLPELALQRFQQRIIRRSVQDFAGFILGDVLKISRNLTNTPVFRAGILASYATHQRVMVAPADPGRKITGVLIVKRNAFVDVNYEIVALDADWKQNETWTRSVPRRIPK
jgi:hypothetical protein